LLIGYKVPKFIVRGADILLRSGLGSEFIYRASFDEDKSPTLHYEKLFIYQRLIMKLQIQWTDS